MDYCVYIIFSENSNRYYCGSTSNLGRRVEQHNDSRFDAAKTTSRYKGPWVLIWSEEQDSKTQALKKERWIKKRGIKRFLQDIGCC